MSTYEKGAAYVNQDRIKFAASRASDTLTSFVKGSGKSVYNQVIRLSRDATGLEVDGDCSCPVGWNCKHVAATLVYWSRENKKVSLGTGTPGLRLESISAPPPPVLKRDLKEWLDSLETVQDDSQKSKTVVRDQLVYRLYTLPARGGLPRVQIEVGKMSISKTPSAPSKIKRYAYESVNWLNPPGFLTELDVELLRGLLGLRGMRYTGSSDVLHLDYHHSLLKQILASGRALWMDAEAHALSWGAELRARFEWRVEGDEGMRLVPLIVGEDGIPDGEILIFMANAPLYFDQRRGLIGPVAFGIAGDRLERLLNAPTVAPDQVFMFQAEVRKRALPVLPLPSETLQEVNFVDVDPVAVFRLTTVKRRIPAYGYGRRHQEMTETQAVGRLSFRYGEIVVGDGAANVDSHRVKAGQIVQVRRRLDKEQAARSRLSSFGFTLATELDPYGRPRESKDYIPEDGPLDWFDFLYRDAAALEAEGMIIEVDADFPFRLARATGGIEGGIGPAEGSGMDWFDLHLGVHVGGRYVDLIEPLLLLIETSGIDDFGIFDADDLSPFLLPLDDGSALPLDIKTLLPLLEGLKRLFAYRQDGAARRLSRYDAALFADAVDLAEAAEIRWDGVDGLLQLGRAMRDVGKIEDVILPDSFLATLRPYQRRGVAWMHFLSSAGLGGILADEMGLGKTVQSLGYIALEKSQGRLTAPTLIVAPTSLMANWKAEAAAFTPDLKVVVYHGPDRHSTLCEFDDADIVLTTYPLLVRDKDNLIGRQWGIVILDEAQSIKTATSGVSRLVRDLKAQTRFCLTGTPLENHLGEVWSLMTFLMPGLLGTMDQFNKQWRTPIERRGDFEKGKVLAAKLRPFILRRTKAEVATDLPERSLIEERVVFDEPQRRQYETIRLAMHHRVREAIKSRGLNASQIVILDALLKLRQVCCDPSLVKSTTVEDKAPAKRGRPSALPVEDPTSAKRSRLMELMDGLMAEGRKVLVFSQFTSMLDLIEADIKCRGWDYVRLSGDTKDRKTPVQRFQAGKVNIFLISLKAGGVGLNLTAADTVILYDPWWNEAVEDQAIGRAHRIGQTQPVFVYRLIATDTIEEKMGVLKAKKKALADALLSEEIGFADAMTEADIEALFAA